MATRIPKKGDDAALAVAVLVWIAQFLCAELFVFLLMAILELRHFELFRPRRPISVAEVIIGASGTVAALILATIVSRAAYRALRQRWAGL